MAAQHYGNRVELSGYRWWISQTVDAVWARFEMDPEEERFSREI